MMLRNSLSMYRYSWRKKASSPDLKNLILLLRPEWKLYCIGGFITGLSSALALVIPQAFKAIGEMQELKIQQVTQEMPIQEAEEIQKKNQEIRTLYLNFTLKWGLLCTLTGVFGFYRRYINTMLTNRIAVRLRNALYQSFLSQNTSYFQNKNILSSDLVHKLANDVSLVSWGLTMELVFGIRGLFFVVGGSAYLMAYAQPLVPPAILMMLVLGFGTKAIGKYQRMYKILETESLGRTSQIAQERLQAIKLIKVSDTEQREKETYRAELSRFYENSRHSALFNALNFGILEGLGFFSLIGILTYGSFLITNDMANTGMVSSSIYALYIAIGFRSLINTYTELLKTSGIYEGLQKFESGIHNDPIYQQPDFFQNYLLYIEEQNRINRLVLNPPEQPDEDDLIITLDQEQTPAPSIEFKNVRFNHQGQRTVLDGFDMKVESGEIVALLGQSGSGKTTILNLLTKLISPTSGDILIDGESVKTKDFAWIQRYVSYVPQEAIIFSGTIYENIIYGNHGFDQSLDRVKWAAKMANADLFIEQMDKVYKYMNAKGYLSDLKSDGGVSLSGGQKQRIVLARAILKNPKILILDEATSNLDPEAEKIIIQALKKICQNRTCLIVTHKIDTYKELITRTIDLRVKNQTV